MLRALLPLLCIGWLIGVGWGSAWAPLAPVALAVVGMLGVGAAGLSRGPLGRLVGVFFLALLLGAFWADYAARLDRERSAAWVHVAEHAVRLTGTIASVEHRGVVIAARVHAVRTQDGRTLPGRVQITISEGLGVREGDRVQLIGRVRIPEEDDPRSSFRPFQYFSRFAVYATMRNPKVAVLEEGTPSALTRLREALRGNILHALPEPSAGLLSAILLSTERDLPWELRDVFALSGLTHLIAISGSHIALISGVVFFGMAHLGLPRWLASSVTLVLTLVFLALVGFPASGVRSLLMVGVVFWAYAAGRWVQGLRALLLAAAVMTAFNPRVLLGDVGFQLSVVAMWGLLAFYPVLARRVPRVGGHLRTIVLLTIAAEVATAPLVAYTFGRVPLVGPLTNIIAVPLFPVLLAGAFLAATLGGVPLLASLVQPLAHAAATAFTLVGTAAVALPRASVPVPPFSPWVLGILYTLLLVGTFVASPHRVRGLRALARHARDGVRVPVTP